jgi:hypothetical protein
MKPRMRTLGTPPAPSDTRDNLKEPEVAPSGRIKNTRKVDRSYQINAGVSFEFRNHFNDVAKMDGLSLKTWELLMVSLAAFERLPKAERLKLVEEIRRQNPPAFRTYKDK